MDRSPLLPTALPADLVLPRDTGSLIEASSFLIDRGYCGLVWLDTDLVVKERTGELVDFVPLGEPVGTSIIALHGCEDDIADLRRIRQADAAPGLELPRADHDADGLRTTGHRRIEMSNIRILDATGEGHRLNFYVHWLETSGRYLLIVLRTTTQTELEAELENQSRRRALAEAIVVEQRNQLATANAELTRANRELTEYANIIAHDLKSPLRAMRYHAEDIEAALSSGDQQRTFEKLAELRQQSKRMSRMLTDLLAYAMIGRAEDELEPTDTRALAEAIISSLPRPRGFVIELAGDWPILETAEPALDVVLRNLIDNAIRHHDRTDGRIVITATPGPGQTAFAVADDGPGIPRKYHEVIFLPFRRLENAETTAPGGSGIGLSLVRKTTETAGGALTVESNPDLARGTTFRLIWPGRLVSPRRT